MTISLRFLSHRRSLWMMLLLSMVSFKLRSQTLRQRINYDTLVYVYPLLDAQLDDIFLRGSIADTNWFFEQKRQSYPRSTFKDQDLPVGNYLVAGIHEHNITYRLVQRSPYQRHLRIIGDDLIVYLNDIKTFVNLENAQITLCGLSMPFDPGYGGYVMSLNRLSRQQRSSNQFDTQIRVSGFYERIRLKVQAQPEMKPYTNRSSGFPFVSEGYVVSDKPVYRKGDTLRLKAWLMNPFNGKALKRKVKLFIQEPGQGFTFQKTLKRVSPGGFIYDWPVPDSLKIDHPLQITFSYHKRTRNLTRSHQVYLEDYRLQKQEVEARLGAETVFAGEDIQVFVSSKDINGFPMIGTKVNLKLSLLGTSQFLADTLTLSAAYRSNLFQADTVLSYMPYLMLSIPWQKLPPVNGHYQVQVTFTDPQSFEEQTKTLHFQRIAQQEKVLFYQQDDSVSLRVLFNAKDTVRIFRLIALHQQDTLFNKMVNTPYHAPLNPYITRLIALNQDSVAQELTISHDVVNITRVEGRRSADSLRFRFAYPFDEPVYYRLYKGNRLIRSGKERELSWSVFDDSRDPYTLAFTTNLNGQIYQNHHILRWVPPIHQIQLKHNLPEQAFPGQPQAVDIDALDYRGKPLSGVNLAAFAQNLQLGDRLQSPYIEIPEAYKDRMVVEPEKSTRLFEQIHQDFTRVYPIQNKHIKRYALQQNEWYALRYPTQSYGILEDTMQASTPEFSVVINHKRMTFSPRYILLDQHPVFFSDLLQDVYSFPAKEGVHDLQIRYGANLIHLKGVRFEAHRKYWISIAIDSLDNPAPNLSITKGLPLAHPDSTETHLWKNHILVLRRMGFQQIRIQLDRDIPHQKIYTPARPPEVLSLGRDQFYVIGPLRHSVDAEIYLDGKAHTLRSSAAYRHFFDASQGRFVTRMTENEQQGWLNFMDRPLQESQWFQLAQPDTVPPPPIPVKGNQDHNRANTLQQPVETQFPQNYQSPSPRNELAQIRLVNDQPEHWVKAVWLINNQDPDDCAFLPGVGQSLLTSVSTYACHGTYAAYFLMNRDRLIYIPHLRLQPGDEFYLNPSRMVTIPVNKETLSRPLKLYNEKTQVPLVPFYDLVDEHPDELEETREPNRKQTFLQGYVSDQGMYPLPNVLVLLEYAGQFIQGARTNTKGQFEFLNLAPGQYQIRLYRQGYQMRVFEARYLQKGYAYTLNTALKPSDELQPVIEVLHNDFRCLGFVDSAQADRLHIELFDRDTREPIQGADIQWFEEGNLQESRLNISSHAVDFWTPVRTDKRYMLKVQCPGYRTLEFSGLQFTPEVFYRFQVFLQPNADGLALLPRRYDLGLTPIDNPGNQKAVSRISIQQVLPSEPQQSGSMQVEVLDAGGRPLHGARILLSQHGWVKQVFYTDKQGRIALTRQSGENYTLHVRLHGYQEVIQPSVQFDAEHLLEVRVILESKPVRIRTLPTVVYTEDAMSRSGAYYSSPLTNNTSMEAPINSYTEGTLDAVQVVVAGSVKHKAVNLIRSIESKRSALPRKELSEQEREESFGKAKDMYVSSSLIQEASNPQISNAVRRQFTDAAYWKPNLVSNRKGKIGFTLQWPDNITTWKSTFIAMKSGRLHGIDTQATRVYKPLLTESIVPSFLYDQDKLWARARYRNLTRDSLTVQTRIMLNNEPLPWKNRNLDRELLDSILLNPDHTDTLYWQAELSTPSGYRDAELLPVPVYSSALKDVHYQSWLLDKDSVYAIEFPPGSQGEILFTNQLYERIVAVADQINTYEYGCVEQTASKLKALLCKDKIGKALDLKYALRSEIKSLIQKLKTLQQEDGSYGWWGKDAVNWRMTCYALEALYQAEQQGYTNQVWMATRDAVFNQYAQFPVSDKLFAARVLDQLNYVDASMKEQLLILEPSLLTPEDQQIYYELKQRWGQTVDLETLFAVYQQLLSRGTQYYTRDFFQDPQAALLNAWRMFRNHPEGADYLKVFRERLKSGEWQPGQNTFVQAQWIEALLEAIELSNSRPVTATLKVNDSITIQKFPYRMPLKHSSYSVKHSGGDVYMHSSRYFIRYRPSQQDSVFKIRTHWEQQDQKTSTLEVGKPCQLVVELDAYRSGDYAMLEVPIPSGMVIIHKPQQAGFHTEYYKNKLVMFFPKLDMRAQTFRFDMMPVFRGECVQAPARCNLMYYPFVQGNNQQQTIIIR